MRNESANPPVASRPTPALERRGVRLTVGLRLLLSLAGLVSFSAFVALTLQDRALTRDLEQAASERLDRAARAAERLVATHVDALAERYQAIATTPQMRASLEVRHAPTLDYYAGELREREGALLVAFVDPENEVIAASGARELLAPALARSTSGLSANDGRALAVAFAELHASTGTVGRLIAVEPIPDSLVASWSELCGARLAFARDGERGSLDRIVEALPGLELTVEADFAAERAALQHSRTNLAIAGAVALALSLLAAGVFTRSFVRPIRAIQHATERIRRGDLRSRIASRRSDEIGDVARAFDAMLDDLCASQAAIEEHVVALSRSRAHLDSAQQRARIGSFELDLATGRVEGSAQLFALYQIPNDGKPLALDDLMARVHGDDRGPLEQTVRIALAEDRSISADFRVVLRDASEHVIHLAAHVVHDDAGRAIRLDGTVQDVTERQRAEEQIKFLAYHDGLTGLGNRRLFAERLRVAIEAARRRGRTLGVLFLDLDHFKRINDTLGHTSGDELLRSVAQRLVHCVRVTDTISRAPSEFESAISRLGGDEFTLLVDQVEDPQGLSLVARRILDELAKPFTLGDHEVVVGASIGIAVWPVDGEDGEALLRNADSAMYHAKEHGRNQYQFYTESMNAAALRRLELEQRMRSGLLNGELEVHYQPKLDLRSGRIAGFEALARWRDPVRGLVLPGEFIPVAEQTGMIVPIGVRVLESACEQIARWEAEGALGSDTARIAVNVSARQFAVGNLVETVREVLERTGASAKRLELEITESTVMLDERAVIETLDELRALGVSVSLDDFGTGYSSLSYLRTLPVDTLKIDMAFVRSIATNREDAALTAAIVSMGKARGLRVVAEGVETEEQRELLASFGCDEIQGFLISAAVPAAEASRLEPRRND